MLHSAQPDWRQRQRQRGRFAENSGLGGAIADVVEDPLTKRDALEIGAVGMQRLLGIRAGFGVIDECARNFAVRELPQVLDRKSTRLNSSHPSISYAVFCLKKKNKNTPA